MDRRNFIRRTALALAGGLVVGDAALEAFARLTHRKVFALGSPLDLDDNLVIYSSDNIRVIKAAERGLPPVTWRRSEVSDGLERYWVGYATVPGTYCVPAPLGLNHPLLEAFA